MSNSYIIDNTDGSITFVIEPGTLDGPGGVNRNSDLYLYGQGATKWGEGVNESLFRLAESFACPEKDPTDAGYIAGEPQPKDENDIGAVGTGITTPLNGQLWYNTDDKKLYVYDSVAAAWRTGSGLYIDTDPAAPVLGDLKYESDFHGVGIGQLTIYDGASFISVAKEYLELDGGSTMTGDLNVGGNTLTNVADPTTADHVGDRGYNDIRYVNVTGDTMSGNLDLGANTLTNIADPTTGDDVADRDYNDARYVNVTGDAMTGALSMGSNKITNVTDPTNPQDAATLAYVQSVVNALLGNLYPVGSIFIGTNPNGTLPGTWTQVADGTFLMASGGTNPPGTTGGANTKTLSKSEMPGHNHGGGNHRHATVVGGGSSGPRTAYAIDTWPNPTHSYSGTPGVEYSGTIITWEGGGAAWDSRPKFEAVEMWKRTA